MLLIIINNSRGIVDLICRKNDTNEGTWAFIPNHKGLRANCTSELQTWNFGKITCYST